MLAARTNRPILAVVAVPLCLAGCAIDDSRLPSLQPRAAETIDPRLPVADRSDSTPADPALGRRLDALVATALGSSNAFDRAIAQAEQAAAGAGAGQSESWIAAQEALSAAVAARYPLTHALADIDSLAAERVQARGGITPADQRQFDAAAAALQPLGQRQADRIRAVQARLGA